MSDSYCEASNSPVSNASHFFSRITFSSAVIVAVMSPLTVAGNVLVLLAIWRNQLLRSPSYFLLGMLSFAYFVSGLIFQPSYAAYELTTASINQAPSLENSSVLFYIRLSFGGFGNYLTTTTILTITLMAIERWLYMTRRSWVTLSRVSKLFVAFLFVPTPLIVFRSLQILTGSYCHVVNTVIICLLAFCFITTTITYFQVLLIIRRHQQQIQANLTSQGNISQPFINLAKYKKSVFTIFFILLLFYLSYFPFVLIVILLLFTDKSLVLIAAYKVSVMLIFVSSMLNPCLYCWRIREIRDGVWLMLKKLLCRNGN